MLTDKCFHAFKPPLCASAVCTCVYLFKNASIKCSKNFCENPWFSEMLQQIDIIFFKG